MSTTDVPISVTAAHDRLILALRDVADLADLQAEIGHMQFDVADRERVIRGLTAVARISGEKLAAVEAEAGKILDLVRR